MLLLPQPGGIVGQGIGKIPAGAGGSVSDFSKRGGGEIPFLVQKEKVYEKGFLFPVPEREIDGRIPSLLDAGLFHQGVSAGQGE